MAGSKAKRSKELDDFLERKRARKKQLLVLREIILKTGLEEEFKRKLPAYTFKGKTIVTINANVFHCVLTFTKGGLLKDDKRLLCPASLGGKNVQLRLQTLDAINKRKGDIKKYVEEAIEIEASGGKTAKPKDPSDLPAELIKQFELNPKLKQAFMALSRSKRHSYRVYFDGGGSASVRTRRIKKFIPNILAGKDLYGK